MIESQQIEKMSTAELLQTIEQIWESLYRDAEHLRSPEWHETILADRKACAQRGEATFLPLDQLRTRLRNSQL